MLVSKEYFEEYGIPDCYEGKIIEIHHIDGDDDINDFIEEKAGNGTIKIRITHQEDDYMWGEMLNGEYFDFHITLQDIGNGCWESED